MGNTDSTISGMQSATSIMDNIPILGGAFQLQQATMGAATNTMGGLGQIGASGNKLLLVAGMAVVVLILIK